MKERENSSCKKFLDIWTAKKIRLSQKGVTSKLYKAESDFKLPKENPASGSETGNPAAQLTRDEIEQYTAKKLKETVSLAVANSPFYREKLKDFLPEAEATTAEISGTESAGMRSEYEDVPVTATADIIDKKTFARLPFTTADELRSRGSEFLCANYNEISRIVTLDTGGSTGEPKRIYFTEEDQQLTVDYFENGMQLIVGSSDKVLILMPAKMPGSIGRLLAQGLENFGAKVVAYGLPKMHSNAADAEAARLLELIKKEQITSVVALPTHMGALAKVALDSVGSAASSDVNSDGKEKSHVMPHDALKLRSVLLSAEYVSQEDVELIEKAFACKVYEHYGMTEMGLGCAVSCGQGEGYHIREADLYIEIIDPETGENIEDERIGEIVFTTLTRKGMPFIRYRTGDYSRWITEECPCGSILKRIAKVGPRNQIKGYLR